MYLIVSFVKTNLEYYFSVGFVPTEMQFYLNSDYCIILAKCMFTILRDMRNLSANKNVSLMFTHNRARLYLSMCAPVTESSQLC